MPVTSAQSFLVPGWENEFPGLVWAYGMSPDGTARRLAGPEEIAGELARQAGWTWLHVDLVDHRCHAWVSDLHAIRGVARAILEHHVEDLVLGCKDGTVHGVCADFHRDLETESQSIGRFCFAVTERLLVTGRRHAIVSAGEVSALLESGFRTETTFDVFGAIVQAFCRHASQRLTAASKTLDTVEDQIASGLIPGERKHLMNVRRLATSMHRPIATLAALFNGSEQPELSLPASGQAVLRRLGDRLAALDREVMMLGDRARLLQEEMSAQMQEETNRSLKTLTIITALLLPGTMVFGIFGMNTGGLPLADSAWGFAGAMGIAVLATLLFYWLLRRIGTSLRL